jgi:hypothetical protein
MVPGVPERRSHDYVRAGTTTLFAALEVATGKVIGSLHRRHRAVEFKRFLAKLDKEVPAALDVHLILDNYVTHKTPAVKQWLLAHPRSFTPTRDTTTPTCNDGYRHAASSTGSPAREGTAPSGWGATVGSLNGPWPGWPAAAASSLLRTQGRTLPRLHQHRLHPHPPTPPHPLMCRSNSLTAKSWS